MFIIILNSKRPQIFSMKIERNTCLIFIIVCLSQISCINNEENSRTNQPSIRKLEVKSYIKSKERVQCEDKCHQEHVLKIQACLSKCRNIKQQEKMNTILSGFLKIFLAPIILGVIFLTYFFMRGDRESKTKKYSEELNKLRREKKPVDKSATNTGEFELFLQVFMNNLYKSRFLKKFSIQKYGQQFPIIAQVKFAVKSDRQADFYMMAKKGLEQWTAEGALIQTDKGLHLWFLSQSMDLSEDNKNNFILFQSEQVKKRQGVHGRWMELDNKIIISKGNWEILFDKKKVTRDVDSNDLHSK